MNGPDCPIHRTPMEWLSTRNVWQFYCRACDHRYDNEDRPMPPVEEIRGVPMRWWGPWV